MVRSWLEQCDSNDSGKHLGCRTPPLVSLPHDFRVINCDTRCIVPWRNLQSALYTALSYVWGIADTTLWPDPGKLPDTAPLVIEDAIKVTKALGCDGPGMGPAIAQNRGMGLRFLWIDKYCIPQDDEEARWAHV
ncbi:hypothetical protein QBC38DRAFT_444118 [Podospora fimiseda]|uniref:Heterokaryon incompatibility domain-containing protein n=1 Tax=Podospora fimiseda TaxID=252190 RepID=A0AAN7BPC9_9PEZI|nr:hypothetical protein QBC38DRAFT_444118 [Podospora fimiseda]